MTNAQAALIAAASQVGMAVYGYGNNSGPEFSGKEHTLDLAGRYLIWLDTKDNQNRSDAEDRRPRIKIDEE